MTPSAPSQHTAVAGIQKEIGEIARGAGVNLGGNVVYYFVSYLFGILVARQIGAHDYGLYTLGVTAITLVSRITLIGLDRGIMRYTSITRSRGQGAALRRLAVLTVVSGAITGLIGGLVVWRFPELIAIRWFHKPDLLPLMPVFAVAIPAMTLTGIAISGTQAFRTMRYRALVLNIIQPIVKLLVALSLIALLGAQAMAPVLGFVVAQVVGTLLGLGFLARLARRTPTTGPPPPRLGRQLARFSLPLLLSTVLEYLNGRTETLVLGMFLVAGAAGIYNAALRLAGLGLIVLTAFNAIFAPVISDLHHRGELEHLALLFKLVTRWVVTVATPLFLIQILFAPQLMGLFGADFVAGAPALRLLSAGQFLNFATGAVGLMLIMSGRSDIALYNALGTVLTSLALDFWLIPAHGLLGAAVAGAIIIGLINVLKLGEVWWLMRVHPFSPAFRKPLLAALPGLAAGLAWQRWLPIDNLPGLLTACMTIGLVYLLALFLQGLDDGDRLVLAATRTRLARLARLASSRPAP